MSSDVPFDNRENARFMQIGKSRHHLHASGPAILKKAAFIARLVLAVVTGAFLLVLAFQGNAALDWFDGLAAAHGYVGLGSEVHKFVRGQEASLFGVALCAAFSFLLWAVISFLSTRPNLRYPWLRSGKLAWLPFVVVLGSIPICLMVVVPSLQAAIEAGDAFCGTWLGFVVFSSVLLAFVSMHKVRPKYPLLAIAGVAVIAAAGCLAVALKTDLLVFYGASSGVLVVFLSLLSYEWFAELAGKVGVAILGFFGFAAFLALFVVSQMFNTGRKK